MSLFQFIIDLLAGFIEKDVVVGGKKSYLFEYDYPLDDGTLVSVKTNSKGEVLSGFFDFANEAAYDVRRVRS